MNSALRRFSAFVVASCVCSSWAAPGDPDPAFGAGGFAHVKHGSAIYEARGVGLQSDGKYLAAFEAALAQETYRGALLRFNADHTLDSTYGFLGEGETIGQPSALAMGAGNTAITAEYAFTALFDFSQGLFHRQIYVARYGTNGRADAITGFSAPFNAGSGVGYVEQRFQSIAIASDGKIVAAGFTTVAGMRRVLVARYNTDLSLDNTFGAAGQGWAVLDLGQPANHSSVTGLRVQADGKVVAAGNFSTGTAFIARVTANGQALDATFAGGAGLREFPFSQCSALAMDATRYLLGCTSSVATVHATDLDGSSPTSANAGGGFDDAVYALGVRGDGKIIAVGKGSSNNSLTMYTFASSLAFESVYAMPESSTRGRALAFTSTEAVIAGSISSGTRALVVTLDTGSGARTSFFYNDPTSSLGYGSVKFLPGGKIAAGGVFGAATFDGGLGEDGRPGRAFFLASRFNANGTLDSGYGINGHSFIYIPNMSDSVGVRDLLVQPDGKLLVTGDFGTWTTGTVGLGVARLDSGIGGYDLTFNQAGTPGYNFANAGPASGSTQFTRGIALQADGKILAGGNHGITGQRQMGIARFNADGLRDLSYGVNGFAVTTFPTAVATRDIALQADGKALIVGNVGPDVGIARFLENGTPDSTFGSGGMRLIPVPAGMLLSAPNRVIARPDGRIVIAVSMLNGSGFHFAGVFLTGDGLFDPSASGGGFTSIQVATGANAGANAFDAALTPNGKLVLAGYSSDDGFNSFPTVARFNRNGSPDTGYGTGGTRRYTQPFWLDVTGVDIAPDGSMALAAAYNPGSERWGTILKTMADPTAVGAEPNDFNADARPDIIWSNTINGATYFWHMNGPSLQNDAFVTQIDPSWKIQGVADFNGDGKPDLIWRNTANGNTYVWYMNGPNFISDAFVFALPPEWVIQGIADFNGDGKPDFLMRNTNSGVAFAWFFNDNVAIGDQFLFGIDSSWKVEQVADLNGDGQPDLLFRSMSSGLAFTWFTQYSGGNLSLAGSTSPMFGIDPVWEVVQLADWNGDGNRDLLFRNRDTGLVFVWYMTGTTLAGSDFVTQIDPSWEIVPRR